MGTRSRGSGLLCAAIVVASVALLYPGPCHAQRYGGSNRSQSSSQASDSSASKTPVTPEPYTGQIFCPVTGAKLGLRQPPVPVQTSIGEKKPSAFGKLFGEKSTPGAVIYVCCPECVETVRKNPELYLGEIIADKACFTFRYAQAPAQRPQRAPQQTESQATMGRGDESSGRTTPLPPPPMPLGVVPRP
jgi:hypothetical protein